VNGRYRTPAAFRAAVDTAMVANLVGGWVAELVTAMKGLRSPKAPHLHQALRVLIRVEMTWGSLAESILADALLAWAFRSAARREARHARPIGVTS
jgi:hypothetical protein